MDQYIMNFHFFYHILKKKVDLVLDLNVRTQI